MLQGDIDNLYELLNKRLKLMEEYNDLSVRFLIDDFDKFDNLLEVRNKFLLEYNKLTPAVDKIVSSQPRDEQEILKPMMKYKGLDKKYPSEYDEIKNILVKTKKLIDSINEQTKKTTKRFNDYKQELLIGIQKLNKSKRVVGFVGSATNMDLFKGKSFDTKL